MIEINNFFEKIYVINLKKDDNKRKNISDQFNKYNINFEFFEGIYGKESDYVNELKKNIKKLNYGELGLLLTYKNIFNDAINKGYNNILIFEDDVILHNDFNNLFSEKIQSIPDDWAILRLGNTLTHYNGIIKTPIINNTYYKNVIWTHGSFACAYKKHIFQTLINEIELFNSAIDCNPFNKIINILNTDYSIFPNLVISDINVSDLRKSYDIFNLSKKYGWNLKDFNENMLFSSISNDLLFNNYFDNIYIINGINKDNNIIQFEKYKIKYTFIEKREDVINLKYDKIIIFDDDIILHNNFLEYFIYSVKFVQPDWNILRLGVNLINYDDYNIDFSEIDTYYETLTNIKNSSYAVAYKTSKNNNDYTIYPNLVIQNNIKTNWDLIDYSCNNISIKNNIKSNLNINDIKFIFIVPAYNVEKWYKLNLDSMITQEYKNWHIIYIDDASTDNTYNLVKKYIDDNQLYKNITIIRNDKQMYQRYNRQFAFNLCEDDDICVLVDGDDWLADNQVLNTLYENYKKYNLNVTYGQFKIFSNNQIQSKIYGNHKFPQKIIKENKYREYNFITQHLRTGKAYLFKSIPDEYSIYNGKWIDRCTDVCEMFWILENCDNKFMNINRVLYIYNKDNSIQYENSWYNNKHTHIEILNHLKNKFSCIKY